MHTELAPNGKWIIWDDGKPYGPYNTKTEAESDRVGMERFLRHGHKPGYLTSERKGK